MNVTLDDVKNMLESNKTDGFVVHITTKEIYDKLMKLFNDFGIKWGNTEVSTLKNYFGIVDNFCVNYDGYKKSIMYSRMDFYKEKGYFITELVD